METARTDVLGALVDDGRKFGDALDRVGPELERNPFRANQGSVLLGEGALWLGEDPHELIAAQRLEFDANRKTSLQLWNEVRRLRDVEGPGGNEQDVVGFHHPVLRIDRGPLDDGK